ncbi:conserved protein of unknown function (plasmid) [Cupriavidus neocaledonicus]|uniref:Uncharacterized protein n=1 Tax=Cupriavidus neocaledonicus TaxID=1040979 RepID=A0A375HVU5_9BURK|nr:conserved hypothetical protein [Cupriavidus neocaledonicus]SPD61146.1 conserved protein of unknown function [Cupriavidus neocaledonicus]
MPSPCVTSRSTTLTIVARNRDAWRPRAERLFGVDLIRPCVPNADTCDPSVMADAIREWFDSFDDGIPIWQQASHGQYKGLHHGLPHLASRRDRDSLTASSVGNRPVSGIRPMAGHWPNAARFRPFKCQSRKDCIGPRAKLDHAFYWQAER